ncbi:hypothetical protein, partial [Streptomyces sp. NPDC007205]|uniref:hypothetical protein n=1 Tax=Streptomyces sp. NPDC007205 TaxID=3154316 RepID=UPI0033EA462B
HPHTSHTTGYSHPSMPIRDFVKIHPDELKSVSKQEPVRPVEGRMPACSQWRPNATLVYWAPLSL